LDLNGKTCVASFCAVQYELLFLSSDLQTQLLLSIALRVLIYFSIAGFPRLFVFAAPPRFLPRRNFCPQLLSSFFSADFSR
jgi:hypothetical protein